MATRREFIDAMAVGAAGVAIGVTAKSYARIPGANERLNFAIIGLNGRGYAHLAGIKANKASARVTSVCDVDADIMQKFAATAQKEWPKRPLQKRTFGRFSSLMTLTRSRSRLRTIGMLQWRSLPCKLTNTFIWRNRAAITLAKEKC